MGLVSDKKVVMEGRAVDDECTTLNVSWVMKEYKMERDVEVAIDFDNSADQEENNMIIC